MEPTKEQKENPNEEISIDKLMEILHRELEKDNWGKVDPYDFHPHGEYYDEMKETLETALKDYKITKK